MIKRLATSSGQALMVSVPFIIFSLLACFVAGYAYESSRIMLLGDRVSAVVTSTRQTMHRDPEYKFNYFVHYVSFSYNGEDYEQTVSSRLDSGDTVYIYVDQLTGAWRFAGNNEGLEGRLAATMPGFLMLIPLAIFLYAIGNQIYQFCIIYKKQIGGLLRAPKSLHSFGYQLDEFILVVIALISLLLWVIGCWLVILGLLSSSGISRLLAGLLIFLFMSFSIVPIPAFIFYLQSQKSALATLLLRLSRNIIYLLVLVFSLQQLLLSDFIIKMTQFDSAFDVFWGILRALIGA